MEESSNLSRIDFLLLIRKNRVCQVEFAELNGKTQESHEIPDADQARAF